MSLNSKNDFDNTKINQKKLEIYPNTYKYSLNNKDYLVLISASTGKVYDILEVPAKKNAINPFIKKSIIKKWEEKNKNFKQVYNTPSLHQILKYHYSLKSQKLKPKNYPNNISWKYSYLSLKWENYNIDIKDWKVEEVLDKNNVLAPSYIKANIQNLVNKNNLSRFKQKNNDIYHNPEAKKTWVEKLNQVSSQTSQKTSEILNDDEYTIKYKNIWEWISFYEEKIKKIKKWSISWEDYLNCAWLIKMIWNYLEIEIDFTKYKKSNVKELKDIFKKINTIIFPRGAESSELKKYKTNIFQLFEPAKELVLDKIQNQTIKPKVTKWSFPDFDLNWDNSRSYWKA